MGKAFSLMISESDVGKDDIQIMLQENIIKAEEVGLPKLYL